MALESSVHADLKVVSSNTPGVPILYLMRYAVKSCRLEVILKRHWISLILVTSQGDESAG